MTAQIEQFVSIASLILTPLMFGALVFVVKRFINQGDKLRECVTRLHTKVAVMNTALEALDDRLDLLWEEVKRLPH